MRLHATCLVQRWFQHIVVTVFFPLAASKLFAPPTQSEIKRRREGNETQCIFLFYNSKNSCIDNFKFFKSCPFKLEIQIPFF